MQTVSLVEEEGGRVDLCFYHWKVRQGLIDSRDIKIAGIRTTSSADIVSDDQRETASALRALGATEEVVQQAMAKRTRMATPRGTALGPGDHRHRRRLTGGKPG